MYTHLDGFIRVCGLASVMVQRDFSEQDKAMAFIQVRARSRINKGIIK
jgi:hypothetical protein